MRDVLLKKVLEGKYLGDKSVLMQFRDLSLQNKVWIKLSLIKDVKPTFFQ